MLVDAVGKTAYTLTCFPNRRTTSLMVRFPFRALLSMTMRCRLLRDEDRYRQPVDPRIHRRHPLST